MLPLLPAVSFQGVRWCREPTQPPDLLKEADFSQVMEVYAVSVTQFLGDGFMAIVRGNDHSRRSVLAAFDLVSTIHEFNEPRNILGLKPLRIRIGISSGEVQLGNVGTFHKVDYTAVGAVTNLAARLQNHAEVLVPCISEETYAQAGGFFVCRERNAELKGFGTKKFWDVIAIKPDH